MVIDSPYDNRLIVADYMQRLNTSKGSIHFSVDNNWKYLNIYFKDFKKSNFYQPSTFSSSEIKSIGFVAFGKDFEAQLDIMEAELF